MTATVSRAQWLLFALLLVSVWINYIDRGNLSVAAPTLGPELHLTKAQVGLVLSSFFWTYALGQFVAGSLVERYDVYRLYALGFALWSLATGLTGFISSLSGLLALRLVLGAGESVAYPCYSKIIAQGFPETKRGLANALVDAGTKAGPAFGTLLGGLLMSQFGWRIFFIVTGLASLIWLVPWLLTVPRDAAYTRTQVQAPSLREILTHRSAWGTCLGLFCSNYGWYFLITWLPWYLVQNRHFSNSEMAIFGSIPYWGLAGSAILSGWLADRLIARGRSVTKVRKGFAISGLLCATIMASTALVPNDALALTLLTIGCLGFGLYSANVWAITQTLAGPVAAGKWTGLQNGVGNFAGIVAPWLTGRLLQSADSFVLPFAVVGANFLVAAASFAFIVGRVERVRWSADPVPAARAAAL